MDIFLDKAWFYIFSVIQAGANLFEQILAPLHFLGPAPVISLLALLTVVVTRFCSKTFTTKRYKSLEHDFNHWLSLREETLEFDDIDKGKCMARNIDQAKLNRVYYDYFLEGFLLSMATTYFPLACMAAYVNEYYKAERLVEIFHQPYLFEFGSSAGTPILIGGLFWYVISVAVIYLIWSIPTKYGKLFFTKIFNLSKQTPMVI